MWIALPGQDRFHDGQTGGSGQIADDVVNLQVHLVQGLLHVLEMKSGHLNEVVTMAPQRTHSADLIVRTEGAAQESDGMKVLYPLAILNISFSTRHVLDVMGINQAHVELAFLQDLE